MKEEHYLDCCFQEFLLDYRFEDLLNPFFSSLAKPLKDGFKSIIHQNLVTLFISSSPFLLLL